MSLPSDPNNWPSLPPGTPLPWATTSQASSNASRSGPPVPPPPPPLTTGQSQFRPPDFNNESEIKFYIHASTSICKMLQDGMENPEEYLCNINEMYSMQGLPFIDVPNN